MKRLVLATTSLVVAGGMAAADVEVTGSAELGVAGKSGADVQLHRDIRVKFKMSAETDTGLSFGAAADFHNAGKYRAGGTEGAVHLAGAFGTLTLGNTDGAFDKALTETSMGGSIADNETSHDGYSNKFEGVGGGNAGLDGWTGNGGGILRYDYTLGGVTASISGEFDSSNSSESVFGAGVEWAGDVGGIGMTIGLGWQSGSGKMDMVDGSPAMAQMPVITTASAIAQAVTPDTTGVCQSLSLNDDGTLPPAVDGTLVNNVVTCPDGTMWVANGDAADDVRVGQAAWTADQIAAYNELHGLPMPAMAAIPDSTDNKKASIIGASWKVDMGNGLTTVLNYSRRSHELSNTIRTDRSERVTTTHTGIGVGYEVGDMTVGVNAGTSTSDSSIAGETKRSGVGVAVVYSLGTGVDFKAGVGTGKTGDTTSSNWSAGLAFSF